MKDPLPWMWIATRQVLIGGWYEEDFSRKGQRPDPQSMYRYLCEAYAEYGITVAEYTTYDCAASVMKAHWLGKAKLDFSKNANRTAWKRPDKGNMAQEIRAYNTW